jgi:HD-like signal output (HDOD) protein
MDRATVGETLQAGILHDIGQLILATHLPDAFDAAAKSAASRKAPLFESEREIVGATHAEIGAYLLGLWGLPDNTVEAVAFHHQPTSVGLTRFAPLAAVHAADAFIHAAVEGPDAPDSRLSMDLLAAAGHADRLNEWRAIAEDTLSGMEPS